MVKQSIFWSVIGLLALILVFGSWYVVPAGSVGVLTTFGAASPNTREPGFHWKLPLIQGWEEMATRVQKNELKEDAASLDLQTVTVTVATNWSVGATNAPWVYQKVGLEPILNDRIIQPTVSNAVKAVVAQYNVEELVVKREEVRRKVEAMIQKNLADYHIDVGINGVNIVNFSFSPDYERAIEAKQVAQQRAQQAQYELQQAQVEANRQIAQAQGQAQAQKLLQQTLTPELIQQQAIQRWDGHLPSVVGGNGVLPMVGNLSGK